MDQVSRANSLTFAVRTAKGKTQQLFWLCKIQVQIESLHVHKLFWTWCQFHPFLCKKIPVHFIQDSSGICCFRNISLIHSHEKQCLDLFQSGSFHISYKNLIHTWRNQGHLCLRQTGFQKLTKFLDCNQFIPKDLNHTIQKIHNNTVNLSVFFFHGSISHRHKIQFLLFKFFLDLTFYNKIIQTAAILLYLFSALSKDFCKVIYFLHKSGTAFINLQNIFSIHSPVNPGPVLLPSV